MKKQIFCLVCAILCALIWGANFAADLYFEQPRAVLTSLHGLCAVVWALAAVEWALRICRARKEQAGKNGGDIS
ncbi:MAG: hypothetical protein IKR84_04390 [Oscillibacter sp.]|nr:hypothetical protein [Oscillibacter sp.]